MEGCQVSLRSFTPSGLSMLLAAALTVALVAAALLVARPPGPDGVATLSKAAALTELVHELEHELGEVISTGDSSGLQRALSDLERDYRLLVNELVSLLGAEHAMRHLGALEVALEELPAAVDGSPTLAGATQLAIAVSNVEDMQADVAEVLEAQVSAARQTPLIAGGLLALAATLLGVALTVETRRQVRSRRAGGGDTAAQRLTDLTHDLPDMVFEADGDGRITYVSPASSGLLGYAPELLIGRRLRDIVSPAPLASAPRGDGEPPSTEVLRSDGEWTLAGGGTLPARTVARIVRDSDGAVRAIRGVVRDRADGARAEGELRASEERFRAVLNTTSSGLMVVAPDGGIRLHNVALRELLDYSQDQMAALHVRDLLPTGAFERLTGLLSTRMWSDAAPAREEAEFVRSDGDTVAIELAVSSFHGWDGEAGVLVEVQDVTERKRASETIRHMEDYDSVTGLPNRTLFDRYLDEALAEAERDQRQVAVLMLDLDRFKVVNDTLGHASGDRLLHTVGTRLSMNLSPRYPLARFGGDEFLVLVPDAESEASVHAAADRIVELFASPFAHEGRELYLAASVGVAVYPEHATGGDALVRDAGAAMYRAKHGGGNRYALYDPAEGERGADLLSLEEELRHALDRDEFELHFQPEVDISSGEIVAAEALLRWQHPTRGLVQPADFISVLEETGLIVPVGRWVLRAACASASQWQSGGLTIRVAVNLSARQFMEPDLPGLVQAVLNETGLDPSCLEVEVTETAAIENPEVAIAVLRELGAMGVSTALDDFGTGQSSLERLRQLPIDTLKVDRSFIATALDSEDDEALVRSMVALGHAMGLRVVGEGVETEEQLELLRSMGCELAQGYLYSEPVEAAQVLRLAAGRTRLRRVA